MTFRMPRYRTKERQLEDLGLSAKNRDVVYIKKFAWSIVRICATSHVRYVWLQFYYERYVWMQEWSDRIKWNCEAIEFSRPNEYNFMITKRIIA